MISDMVVSEVGDHRQMAKGKWQKVFDRSQLI
jgi:hypothetical protein